MNKVVYTDVFMGEEALHLQLALKWFRKKYTHIYIGCPPKMDTETLNSYKGSVD